MASQKLTFENQEKAAEREHRIRSREFWVQVIFTATLGLFMFFIAGYLIVQCGEINTGLLVITHIVTLGIGILGGKAISKSKGQDDAGKQN